MTSHDVRTAWRDYALRCCAHRLRKFGFESHVNHYSAIELRALSTMVGEVAAPGLLREAARKEQEAQ